jgi:hypothetical protein
LSIVFVWVLLIDGLECFSTMRMLLLIVFLKCSCFPRTVFYVRYSWLCSQEVLQYLGGYGKPGPLLIYPLHLHYDTAL